jgi:hypothetical protein
MYLGQVHIGSMQFLFYWKIKHNLIDFFENVNEKKLCVL